MSEQQSLIQSQEFDFRASAGVLEESIQRACSRIAPTWPLDRFIAVNPFWERVHRPLRSVAAELTALSGSRLVMPRAWFREEWRHGRLRTEHLRAAIEQEGASLSVIDLEALLETDSPSTGVRARVIDIADTQRDVSCEMSWRNFAVHTLSQFCASYFDKSQGQFGPDCEGGLYESWLRYAKVDKAPALLMKFQEYSSLVRSLPKTARELLPLAIAALDVPESEYENYLTSLLLDLNGWASWCAYRRWTARLSGGDDAQIVDLLAMRLAWEWMLLRAGGLQRVSLWQSAMTEWPAIDRAAAAASKDDWLLQRAVEIAWQQEICSQLPAGFGQNPGVQQPLVQAVFCIDVRSEVFRRALEAETPRVQTLGFAGFFGLPAEYTPVGSPVSRPQLPGLLAPRFRVTDAGVPAGLAAQRKKQVDADSAWAAFKTSAASTFAFVEATGILSSWKLLLETWPRLRRRSDPERAGLSAEEHALRKPRLDSKVDGTPLTLEDRTALAVGILRAMSLTSGFAKLVVLIGHGSLTRNNPFRAGLECGACGGQTGEVNARAVAALLNEPDVRQQLPDRGIVIPDDTVFAAGLHNTATDDVELFDLADLPREARTVAAEFKQWLACASDTARRERAGALGITGQQGDSLRNMETRALDWAQVRPEWGLANNAAFIIAPRDHVRHLNLSGRAFLHDYRHQDDSGFSVLELLMTAPMVVTHWINFQYYASTTDNTRYGSGNKVLHNVVGGHLGVFEGNGGDLRIGLPLQSLHDGQRWIHKPLRLSVFIEAPQTAMEYVLSRHDKIRNLVENDWLHLFQIDPWTGAVHAYRRGTWISANRDCNTPDEGWKGVTPDSTPSRKASLDRKHLSRKSNEGEFANETSSVV